MVAQSFIYQGGLRTVAKHEPSSVTLTTDAPKDNMERGESFSPTDLVVTALAACKLTTHGLRKIAKIAVKIDFCKGVAADFRERLEHAAMSCPVAKSLSPEVDQSVTFNYPD